MYLINTVIHALMLNMSFSAPVHIQMYVYTKVFRVYIHKFACMQICVYIYTRVYLALRVRFHTLMHKLIHTNVITCTYTYTHTYTYIVYICTHTHYIPVTCPSTSTCLRGLQMVSGSHPGRPPRPGGPPGRGAAAPRKTRGHHPVGGRGQGCQPKRPHKQEDRRNHVYVEHIYTGGRCICIYRCTYML